MVEKGGPRLHASPRLNSLYRRKGLSKKRDGEERSRVEKGWVIQSGCTKPSNRKIYQRRGAITSARERGKVV